MIRIMLYTLGLYTLAICFGCYLNQSHGQELDQKRSCGEYLRICEASCTLRGNLFRSTDFGKSWQQIKLLSESGPLEFGLANGSLLKDGTLVIVGHGGSVLTSKDAGRAFTVVNRADRASLAGATDDAAGNLVLVGQGGVHLATPTGVEPGKKQ